MRPRTVLCVFGTRPEAIKMAPLVKAMEREPGLKSVVCVTAQHRSMLDQVLNVFGIAPDYDLDVMLPDQTLNGLLTEIIRALDPVLDAVRPDVVLTHGDTTTALAAGLSAFHRRIPVGHVEAGLRTYDPAHPWPEEMNRQLVDRVSTWLFAPTPQAAEHLAGERLSGKTVVTGNTVVDALQWMQGRILADAGLRAELERQLPPLAPGRRLVLVTGHRRENFGAGLEEICAALADISERKDVDIVYPVHLNPHVSGPVRARLAGRPNIHLIPPLGYAPFVDLMRRASIVLTDSGGVQEEAPSLCKPVLVMRDVTERPEAVAAGTVQLVGAHRTRIVAAVTRLLDDAGTYARFARCANPYGDGRASARIVDVLCGRVPRPFPERGDRAFPSGKTEIFSVSASCVLEERPG